jgi:hypothetical protein
MGSRTKVCEHGNIVCEKCASVISDEAKRLADGINGLLAFNQPWEIKGKWIAITLQDGSVDSALYDTRDDAIRHQSSPQYHFYLPMGNFGGGINHLDAELILQVQRHAYERGFIIVDNSAPQVITPFEQGDAILGRLRAGIARRQSGH